MFLLLLISTHEMRRLMLMVNDVNSFTDISHQYQPIILTKIENSKSVFIVFVYSAAQVYESDPNKGGKKAKTMAKNYPLSGGAGSG